MKELFKWLIHPVERWYALKVLNLTSGLFTYPVLLELTLNKDKYYNKYLLGESYKSMIIQLVNDIALRLKRGMQREVQRRERQERRRDIPEKEHIELLLRYQRYCDRIIQRAKQEEFDREFAEAEEAYKTAPSRKTITYI